MYTRWKGLIHRFAAIVFVDVVVVEERQRKRASSVYDFALVVAFVLCHKFALTVTHKIANMYTNERAHTCKRGKPVRP